MLALEVLYLVTVSLLAVYGLNSLLLTWLYWRADKANRLNSKQPQQTTPPENSPIVTIQLPIYNERHVVKRLIDAAVNLDWPADRLQIQVLDDSTDDTRQLIATTCAYYEKKGIRLDHIRRADRLGFKAGALQHGLQSASGEFIAIFDADFVPNRDFLHQTIPCFNDSQVGCVQTRWGHVNSEVSRLTRAQALGIDGHFVIEQSARHALKAFLNFNGTAGVWRRTCIAEAGGWQSDTLTEDLDLSYRAQLGGWRITYRVDTVVPAELPVQVDAFKRQQFRWAKGSIQTAIKLLGHLWQAPQPVWLKFMGTMHLTNYAVHPLMLINLLLTLPIIFSDSYLLILTPLFTVSAVGPPLLYWITMRPKSLSIPARLGRLGLLIALGTGLSLNNSKAVLEAILRIDSEFKRTPKFAVTDQDRAWQSSTYALPHDATAWVELLLGLYALSMLSLVAMWGIWWLIPWLLLYTVGYGYVSGLAFTQARQTHLARLKAIG